MTMTSTPHEASCIFCKIVAGEVPCYALYDDQHVRAFLDVGPLSRGHALIVPKGHWTRIDQVPAEVAGAMGALLPRLSRAVVEAAGASAWNVLQNNGRAAHQAVDHVHMHIIPKFEASGLEIGWHPGELDAATAEPLQQAIVQSLPAG
jgi:histidine triad (HIT) family protein